MIDEDRDVAAVGVDVGTWKELDWIVNAHAGWRRLMFHRLHAVVRRSVM